MCKFINIGDDNKRHEHIVLKNLLDYLRNVEKGSGSIII